MSRSRGHALAMLVLAACDAPASGLDGGDGGPPSACAAPTLDAPWLEPQLVAHVTELARTPRAAMAERAAARAYLRDELAALGWTPEAHTYTTGANVYATIPATMPAPGDGAEILVGAHFDSFAGSPGANDNATGVAVVLAVARYLADTPCRGAPVTVVLFDGEETGLVGSRAFALTRIPASVRAVHTIDQVGWDSDGDRRFELEVPTPVLAAEYQAAAGAVGALVTTTSSLGTDHEAFRDRGFAAIGLTEEYVGGDTSPYRHEPTDTAATVDVPYLVLAAKLTAHVILAEVGGSGT